MKNQCPHSECPRQRESDHNFFKRIWKKGGPHICTVIVIAVFTAGGYWTKWQAQAETLSAHEMRITTLEQQEGTVLQSLQDIKDFLGVPVHPIQFQRGKK